MSDQHPDESDLFTARFWDERYATSTRVWSGQPNQRLVEQAGDLTPGRALDVGCGEGADAVWLAGRGWRVTGVDVSQVALDRAAAHAAEAGVADRVEWRRADLVAGDPLPGGYDLVTSHFLHLPDEAFAAVNAAAAAAVGPGGLLLVVGHHPSDVATGLRNAELSHLLFDPERVLEVLAAADSGLEVLVAEGMPREVEGREGEPVTVTDTVVLARRPG